MDEPVFCADGGYVVGMRFTIPDDPAHAYAGGRPFLGCNRIRCRRCGELVRRFDGFWTSRKREAVGFAPTALFTERDPEHSIFLSREAGAESHRVYVCRCITYQTSELKELADLDGPDWACDGHPGVIPTTG